MCRPPSSGRVRGRACGLPHPASGWQSLPSVMLHVCVLTGARRRRRHGHCPPFHAATPRDVDRLSSGVQREGGGGDSPARRPRADGRCTSPVALPHTLPLTVLSTQLPAMLIVRRRDGVPSSAGNGAGSGR